MLFGRLIKNPVWIRRWTGADPAALAAAAGPIARAVREQLLVQTRWELVMIHMERALYRDPAQDLRALWWTLVTRFQGLRVPEVLLTGNHAEIARWRRETALEKTKRNRPDLLK